MKKTRIYHLFLILIFLGTASCAQSTESTPNAWIDYPQDGDVFASGETVTIISHLFAKGGVAEVVLSINGEAYRRDIPVDAGQEFVSSTQDWVTGEAGIYSIQVQAYDQQGQVGNPAVISIEVLGNLIPEVPTAVITPTYVPTGIPTNTPTFTPHPPTPTLVPPTYIPTTPPADMIPPPAPTPVVPANGLALTCRSTQTLAWMPVNDSSGIDGYYVKLEKEISAGNWQSAGGYGPLNDKQVDVPVVCGIRYRWMVRAQDGAGNYSGWSAPSIFSVALN